MKLEGILIPKKAQKILIIIIFIAFIFHSAILEGTSVHRRQIQDTTPELSSIIFNNGLNTHSIDLGVFETESLKLNNKLYSSSISTSLLSSDLRIVCYGDSITEVDYPYEYVALLQNNHPEWEVIDEGRSGWRSEAITDLVESTAATYQPDIATIMMGVNDVQGIAGHCWQCDWDNPTFPQQYSLANYSLRVQRSITALQNANPNIRIILIFETPMTRNFVTRPWTYMMPEIPILVYPNNYHVYYQRGYDDILEQASLSQSGVEFVNIRDPIIANWTIFANAHGWVDYHDGWKLTDEEKEFNREVNDYMMGTSGLHPNARGHEIIYQNLLATILTEPPVTSTTTTTSPPVTSTTTTTSPPVTSTTTTTSPPITSTTTTTSPPVTSTTTTPPPATSTTTPIVSNPDIDTDGDGLIDRKEINIFHTNPLASDTDNDGLTDREELMDYKTDPNNEDTDWDGLTDGSEALLYNTNPHDPDTDNDGLTDREELMDYKTDPNNEDTDWDGLNDGREVLLYNTNPHDPDTDNDGMTDAEEVNIGSDPVISSTRSPILTTTTQPETIPIPEFKSFLGVVEIVLVLWSVLFAFFFSLSVLKRKYR